MASVLYEMGKRFSFIAEVIQGMAATLKHVEELGLHRDLTSG